MHRFVSVLITTTIALILATLPTHPISAQTPESFDCPVTLPNNVDAPGALDHYAQDGHTWFQNGIWITIPTNGILEVQPAQQNTNADSKTVGWGFEKLHVLRGEDVNGMVEITGQRLDKKSKLTPTNDSTVDHHYGPTGFVPVALLIPGEGCWEFTASAGNTSATWVLEVRFVDAGSAFVCPVTFPNTSELMGLPKFPGDGMVYNEDDLWVAIPANGVLEFSPKLHGYEDEPGFEEWLAFKLHVHRGANAKGNVTITGQRLDKPSELGPTNILGVEDGYRDIGFLPVSLMIPAEGCWELTATAGDSIATWVVDVRINEEPLPTPESSSQPSHRIHSKSLRCV